MVQGFIKTSRSKVLGRQKATKLLIMSCFIHDSFATFFITFWGPELRQVVLKSISLIISISTKNDPYCIVYVSVRLSRCPWVEQCVGLVVSPLSLYSENSSSNLSSSKNLLLVVRKLKRCYV